jgi:hypothetical protein
MFAVDPYDLDFDDQVTSQPTTLSRHSHPGVAVAVEGIPTRESRRATVSESTASPRSRLDPPISRNQAADYEKRISALERAVEGLARR